MTLEVAMIHTTLQVMAMNTPVAAVFTTNQVWTVMSTLTTTPVVAMIQVTQASTRDTHQVEVYITNQV